MYVVKTSIWCGERTKRSGNMAMRHRPLALRQERAHFLTSTLIPGYTYLLVTRRCVARMPGEKWSVVNQKSCDGSVAGHTGAVCL